MPELTRAHRDDVEQLLQRQPRLGGRGNGFRDRRRGGHRQHVVHQLQRVAVPGPSDVDDVLAVRREHRLQRLEVGRLGADHRVEPAFLGFLRRAGQRGVDEACAACREVGADARARCRFGGRRVDHVEARSRRGEQAVIGIDVLFHLRRAGDAEDHDIGTRRQFGARADLDRAGGEQILQVGAVAMRLEAECEALGEQVLRDAVAHHAEADESDAHAHEVAPVGLTVLACAAARALHHDAMRRR